MKREIAIIFFVFLGTLAPLFPFSDLNEVIAGDSQPLQLEISLEKDAFLLREPIWVEILLTNTGNSSRRVTHSSPHRYLRLYIVSSKGDTLSKRIITSYMRPPKGTVLKQGESILYTLNLLTLYGGKEDKFNVRYFITPDTYSIQAEQTVDIWSSPELLKIKSNLIRFTVKNPTGEELKACQLLKEAYELQIQEGGETPKDEFRHIVELYPNSVYADLALMYISGPRDGYKELFENYPNSPFVRKAVSNIADFYKDKEGTEKAVSVLKA